MLNNTNKTRNNRVGYRTSIPKNENKASKFISNLYEGNIRIINFGGVEEIGRNMCAIEYKDTILVIDSGVQFNASKTPGVDFIIPNSSYLKDNKDKVKAIILTNSKLEHSGAISYLLKDLNPTTIYARLYTKGIVEKRLERQNNNLDVQIVPIEEDINFTIGQLNVNFWNITDALADSLSVAIGTTYGEIVYTNDTQVIDENSQFKRFENKNVLCLIADSAAAEQGGRSEKFENIILDFKKVIQHAKQRILVSTFPSNIEHIIATLNIARDLNKKVIIDSVTIREVLTVAQEICKAESYQDILIDIKDIEKFESKNLLIFVTGDEGSEFNNLTKIANGAHPILKIQEDDVIIIAANSITHNQRTVQKLKDNLSRQGAHVTHYKSNDINLNSSGYDQDLEILHRKLHPNFFIPIRGCHYMLRVHADIERKMETPENHIIIPDNGMVIEIRDEGKRIANTREKVNSDMVVIDGMSIGKVQEVVMRDRETLSQQGVFIIMAIIDGATHKLKKSPDIASRGFVYLKESQELLYDARTLIKTTIEAYLEKNRQIDIDSLKLDLQNVVSKFLVQKTAKEPVIIPVIIKV